MIKRQCRASSKSRQSTTKLTVILAVAIFVVSYGVLLGWRTLMCKDFLPFKSVTLHTNSSHMPVKAIKSVIMNNVSGGFFSYDDKRLRDALMAHAWVKQVTFRREFPSTLDVTVEQRQPVAYWGKGGLLSRAGVVFFPESVPLNLNMAHLNGPVEQSLWLFSILQDFNQRLKPLHLQVKTIDLNQRLTMRVVLSNDTLVIVGSGDWGRRFNRFVALYPRIQARDHQLMQQVDLRYPNGVAVKYQPVS